MVQILDGFLTEWDVSSLKWDEPDGIRYDAPAGSNERMHFKV